MFEKEAVSARAAGSPGPTAPRPQAGPSRREAGPGPGRRGPSGRAAGPGATLRPHVPGRGESVSRSPDLARLLSRLGPELPESAASCPEARSFRERGAALAAARKGAAGRCGSVLELRAVHRKVTGPPPGPGAEHT